MTIRGKNCVQKHTEGLPQKKQNRKFKHVKL